MANLQYFKSSTDTQINMSVSNPDAFVTQAFGPPYTMDRIRIVTKKLYSLYKQSEG